MSVREKVQHIELKFETQKVSMKGLPVWLCIRGHFFSKLFEKNLRGVDYKTSNLISLFFASFRGWNKWLKHYDYWIITGSNLRQNINGKYTNILFDYPASQLDSSLFIELPLYKHHTKKETASKNLASKGFLIILETIYSKLFLRKALLSNSQVLNELIKEYPVEISFNSLSKKMVAQYKIMKWVLKYKKPKAIFINTSYTNYGYIKAFKESGIPVIELQHGTIGKDHFSYNLFGDYDDDFFPDYLLTFGNQEKNVFEKPNQWISNKNLIPVGSFIIENTIKYFTPDTSLKQKIKDFNFTFCVSLQETDRGNQLITELASIASNHRNLLFIFIPRTKTENELRGAYNLPENIIFTPQLNVYEAILHSDFHITIYSTCAIEAPSLGIRNILYNIDNKAYSYYKDTLSEETTHYVNNESEFMNVLANDNKPKKIEIQKANENVIAINYFENMNRFLTRLQNREI